MLYNIENADLTDEENIRQIKVTMDNIENKHWTFRSVENPVLVELVISKFKEKYKDTEMPLYVKNCILEYYLYIMRTFHWIIDKFDEDIRQDMIDYINNIAGTSFTINDKESFVDFVVYDIKFQQGRPDPFYI